MWTVLYLGAHVFRLLFSIQLLSMPAMWLLVTAPLVLGLEMPQTSSVDSVRVHLHVSSMSYAQVPLLSSPWEGSVQDQSLPVSPLPLAPQMEGPPLPSPGLILESPLLTSLHLTASSSVEFHAWQSTWIILLGQEFSL